MRMCLFCAAFACATIAPVGAQVLGQDRDIKPEGKGNLPKDPLPQFQQHGNGQAGPPARVRGSGISYHGGPVMTAGPNVYYIWYGNWSAGDQKLLTNLIQHIGGTPCFNINTTYTDGGSTKVANKVTYMGARSDNYSHSTSLNDAAIQAIVAAGNPTDTNGIYFVLTSADVNETSGFCTQYCGWHTNATINGRDIKYAFIGNPARCPAACTNGTPAPNASVGADGAASIIAHELEEATTDPDLNAWYDNRGSENADKCAWTFGSTYSNGTGTANMNLGGKDYLIQQNWVNASSGYCAKSY